MSFRSKFKQAFNKILPPGSRLHRVIYRLARDIQLCFAPENFRYRRWIRQHDRMNMQDLQRINQAIAASQTPPRFSILMPVYNPAPHLLDAAIRSVRDQVYPEWELCIADDFSTKTGVREVLLRHASEDERIKVEFRPENGHISAASNSALALASGDYVAFLDHDDLLHPLALFMAAQELEDCPNCKLIYFDEDKITESGKRFKPYYKSEFDYDLVLSQNMVSHCGIYKLETIRSVGGFQLGMEGSQDHDLLLRVLEKIKPDHIRHIPRVLYHWRTSDQSAAEDINLKPYAILAGERALSEHLERKGVAAQVEFDTQKITYQIAYELPEPRPAVEIIMISQSGDIGMKTLQAIIAGTQYTPLKVTSALPPEDVKAASKILADDPRASVVDFDPKNDNNNSQRNHLIEASDAEYICLLDEAVMEFSDGWLGKLMGQVAQEGMGAVGPKLLSSNGRVLSNGMILDESSIIEPLFTGRSVDDLSYFSWGQIRRGFSVLASECLLFQRKAFLSVGGFTAQLADEELGVVDFCLKLKGCGLRNVLCPSVRVKVNRYGRNLTYNITESQKSYFQEKWGDWLRRDPALNPNLTIRKGRIQITPEEKNLPF